MLRDCHEHEMMMLVIIASCGFKSRDQSSLFVNSSNLPRKRNLYTIAVLMFVLAYEPLRAWVRVAVKL